MPKVTAKNKTVAIAKRYTTDEARRIVSWFYRHESDPDEIALDLAEQHLEKLERGTPKEKEAEKRWLLNEADNVQMMLGLDTHIPLLKTVDAEYWPFVLSVARQTEKENDPKTAIEKMLLQEVVMSHAKLIAHSAKLNEAIEAMMTHSNTNVVPMHGNVPTLSYQPLAAKVGVNKVRAMEALSKQVDRASRQFNDAVMVLQQMKRPPLEVNIVSKNMFVAENQQINTSAKPR